MASITFCTSRTCSPYRAIASRSHNHHCAVLARPLRSAPSAGRTAGAAEEPRRFSVHARWLDRGAPGFPIDATSTGTDEFRLVAEISAQLHAAARKVESAA